MKSLLKSFNLSDEAISIYTMGLGRSPYTFSEIQNIVPNLSEQEIKQIIDDLIEKKLILHVDAKYSESVPHYIIIPPFAAILNNVTELINVSDDSNIQKSEKNLTIQKFQEALYQDLENISGDLIDLLSNKDSPDQSMEILSEVEENVKKFARVILNEVVGMISPLKMQSAVDGRDFNRLINSVKHKISESEEMISNMFSQFRDIVKNLSSSDVSTEVEGFKTFIRGLGESIEKRVHELSLGAGSPTSERIHALEESLDNLLTNYISTNKVSLEKFWIINSNLKIKEIISVLLEKCENQITILVPNIEDFIPLEKFNLDYSEDLELQQKIFQKNKPEGLNIKIISSDSHQNKHVFAFAKKANIEYLQLKNNNIIAILGDNSSLVFGVYQKLSNKTKIEINGFFTTYKPIIEIIFPLIIEITNKAQYPNEIEINREFNEIIENINNYTGRKIGKKLKYLLDTIFEEEGLSLDTLELKLLIGKLERLYQPLDNEMKENVLKELNSLNKKFSTIELIYPPEFGPPIFEETSKIELAAEITPPQIKPLDKEKLDKLFELFLEKVDDLTGVEIGEQLDKFIEIILKLQGYSQIVEWKHNLRDVNETLEEPFKEKIKEDLLSWKLGILQQIRNSSVSIKEESVETHEYSSQETTSSIFEEEYISPGLAQSQFEAEEQSSSIEEESKIDPKSEMKDLFNIIEAKFGELSGIELSKLMQNIVDIILESEGYSMALKDVKDWISKLRKIKEPLEDDIKIDLLAELENWKEQFI